MEYLSPFDVLGTPKCFTLHQFEEWKTASRMCGLRTTICEDCNTQYQNKMAKKGHCEYGVWSQMVFGGRSSRLAKMFNQSAKENTNAKFI